MQKQNQFAILFFFFSNEFTLRTEQYFIHNILSDQLPSNIPIWIFTVSDKYTCMPVDVAFVWQNVQLHVFRIDYGDFQRPRLAFWHSCELWLWKIVTHDLRWVAVLLASKRFFLRNCIQAAFVDKGQEGRFPESGNHTCTHLVSPTRWRKERSPGFWTNA